MESHLLKQLHEHKIMKVLSICHLQRAIILSTVHHLACTCHGCVTTVDISAALQE